MNKPQTRGDLQGVHTHTCTQARTHIYTLGLYAQIDAREDAVVQISAHGKIKKTAHHTLTVPFSVLTVAQTLLHQSPMLTCTCACVCVLSRGPALAFSSCDKTTRRPAHARPNGTDTRRTSAKKGVCLFFSVHALTPSDRER